MEQMKNGAIQVLCQLRPTRNTHGILGTVSRLVLRPGKLGTEVRQA